MEITKIICIGLIVFALISEVSSCTSRRRRSTRCSWSECRTEYTDFSPSVPQGKCIRQVSKANHIKETHTRSSGCPSSTRCTGNDKSRYYCSCRQVKECWWGSWEEWSGSIPQNTCGKQRRYRKGMKSYTYAGNVGSCHGLPQKCPREYDIQERPWCNCRHAKNCFPKPWSSWSPDVENGKCVEQSRYQYYTPEYEFIEKEGSCFGINPDCQNHIRDVRKMCSCPYKECLEGSWTPWELHSWTGQCHQEKRLKKYRSISKYKQAYGSCSNIGPLSCPDPIGDIREKVITCPALPVPANGFHTDPSCQGVNSKCRAICPIRCNHGYEISGNRYVTCQGKGEWSGKQGHCKDTERPQITCPSTKPYNNTMNENYNIIDLPYANATDNSGIVNITISHTSPVKVFVGKKQEIKYTATDEEGNQRSCRIFLEVKDTEPPKVKSCPSDKTIRTGQTPHQVFWAEPTFHDNVDKDYVDVYPSHRNGQMFSKGKHEIVYMGRDQSLNYAKCTFTVQVEMMQCPVYYPPKHGSTSCNIRKDGIMETHICTIACRRDYWFVEGKDIPKVYNYYVCGENGEWRGQDAYDPMSTNTPQFFIPIPKGKSPWPDCTEGKTPDGTALDFQVFGGSCTDEKEVQKLKQKFIDAMKKDLIINNLFCMSSDNHCTLENIVVECQNKNGFSNGAKTLSIKFSFVTSKKNKPMMKHMRDFLNSMSALNRQRTYLQKQVKKSLPSLARGAYLETGIAVVECKAGYEMKLQNATNIECLKCPRGKYYDRHHRNCKVCFRGYFEDEEGQLSCKKCPSGTSTYGVQSHDFHSCKEICPPGTYSSTGLATCLSCPISTYQPLNESTSCIKCPAGKVTTEVGSASLNDCSKPGLNVKIQSEACDDPGKRGECGITNLFANKKDYSLKKRGMNFAVFDYLTGQHISSATFDWHSDFQACKASKKYITNLKDEVIILLGVQDESSSAMYTDCFQLLESIGSKLPFMKYRTSFAMVGYKGKHKVDWIEEKHGYPRQGPTILETTIKLLEE